MQPLFHSLRSKMAAAITLIIVPLVAILLVSNFYSERVVRNQVTQSQMNLLSLYMGQIDRNLEEIDKYLFDMAASNGDLVTLNYPGTRDEAAYTIAKLRLFSTLIDDSTYYPTADVLFAYSIPNAELIMTQNFGKSYVERQQVQLEITRMIQDQARKLSYSKWHVWRGEDRNYLFHVVKTGEAYVGAWIYAEKLMVPMSLIHLGESGAALFTTEQGEPLSHERLVEDEEIDLRFPENDYSVSGKSVSYMVMGETSTQGDFNLVTLLPESEVLEQLPVVQYLSMVLSVTAGLFILLFFYFMRRIFLLPFKQIIFAMRKVRDGNWDVRLDRKPSSREFEILNDTFEQMIYEIQRLKIDVYEEKLNHQKAELKHLQLQINPHFFLNSLNIIYNLATVKDFVLIQELSKCLVIYFRYMFRSNSYFVALKDELQHTANYLRIQQLRFPNSLRYRVDEPPDALLARGVPPLIVQTMVENTIKHVVNIDEQIDIFVSVHRECEDGGDLRIIVRDTGPGFPAWLLEQIDDDSWLKGEHEQIGIWNAKKRLRLLYGDKGDIRFYNHSDGGAVVEITIPDLPNREELATLV